ncbi:monoacylglycerol lipase ABHD12 isoform X1 [Acyrthosiphon pisum]|uniref:Serine aminopeptidase S33 domain-containing protein n=1 Tax=Acyrthosiphon pisum TaxID=7029 RepID=A0A8R2B4Y1_ACYPI|nr:monoacylglycerol lipase ABHD12 isoform X1 [Acyrthosiphon pisum]XP_008181880.1 monoacylglycerol lipase ABHD12 isoform X1 [Acyrthosiphon pisum]XP_008181882.1 monoacylglycerol lipase ABHD12 isoform X1 [Acyrthosiphon pisum]|eukprot:XP_003243739.1 PREDICTED: monoacylglycerol lipase ABHD12-like isoform X1 [Acyrthosiphon pisum]
MAPCMCFSFMKPVMIFLLICVFATCCITSSFFAIILFLVFIIIPIVFRYSPSLQRGMIFLNYVRMPSSVNYSHPEMYGIRGTRNFHIKTNDNMTLGVWHVLPRNLLEKYEDDNSTYEQLLSHGEPIVIYMHGNSGTRANEHRVQLYHVLQDINCHVIAVDYRSYADSTDVEVSELGVVTDAMEMFRWVHKRANGTPIFGWGHSLGTGIGAHAYSLLEKEGLYPNGLILEAPFTKMSDEIREYPLTKIHRLLPWFEFFIIEPVEKNNIIFDTETNLMNTKMPILILHARDDIVIPYQLGEKLYKHLLETRKNVNTELVLYDKHFKYGHKHICKDKELGNRTRKFINESINNSPQ